MEDKSPLVADAVAKSSENFDTESTAKEWVSRRIRNLRVKNRVVRVPRSGE